MSGGELTVKIDEIRSHAQCVSTFGDRVGQAADAAAHVASLDDAYGIFCQPFGMMLQEPQQRGANLIRANSSAVAGMSDRLQKCADSYQEIDEKLGKALQDILESIGVISVQAGGR
ncbi:type VII secretion target [Rhodococcus sp. NPDC058521]|uniref:type VII secretion target n=1 Tax=Rhodococcus sp. NPDC058521 TaxID=3346536 RepID=UPI00366904B1